MKFSTALCVVLCSAAITVHAGRPLKYTDEIHEMCQLYSSLSHLQEEKNVRKILGDNHKCDECCINHITVAAKSLVYAFISSRGRWKICENMHHQRGCCLGVEKIGKTCSKDVKDCWDDCFAFNTLNSHDTSKFISRFFSKDGNLSKWSRGVETALGRHSTGCGHTEYDGYTQRGDFGLFTVLVDASSYYYARVMMKIEGPFYNLGNLRALVCMFARAGYGQIMGTTEECSNICKDTVVVRRKPENKLDEVSSDGGETDQTPKGSTQQVPHKGDTPRSDGEAPEATADGEHVTSDSVAVSDSLDDQKQLAHSPNNTGGSFPAGVGDSVQSGMGKKVDGNVTYFVTGGVRQTGESVLYAVLLHFVKTAWGTLLQ
ncbi:hypothetical protein ERJ75_001583200 [Trypanosoma vivax]|nr:hypothetical protein TRVL_05890 [Trypanosoma vivax]KAH8605459.1 hypothetical protein ERJ75_001583200 [Trypanosoma vivax]